MASSSPLRESRAAPPEEKYRLFETVVHGLKELSASPRVRHSLVLMVDDFELYDSTSFEFLRYLVFSLGNLLAAMILIDLFLVLSDVLVLLVSHSEAQEVAHLILQGKFGILFIGVENVMGKIIPALILLIPRLRNLTTVTISSVLVVVGIFFMRYVVVLGGEFLPLL